ncbi:glycosyl hydrolase family 65 protein [Pseudonocardia sp. ICBG601]|uniref:glycosyl hydrolase family 65 protein n=1 Tax=Pseudonocardia sp. ICBG601 TaxID=2846759 RepID=UPI0035ABB85A
MLQSELVANEQLPGRDADDPRLDTALDNVLEPEQSRAGDAGATLVHRTRKSGLRCGAAMEHEVFGPDGIQVSTDANEDLARTTVIARVQPGQSLRVVKYLAYGWSSRRSLPAVYDQVRAAIAAARYTGWDGLVAEQRDYLDDFWATADVEIDGDAELQQAVRLATFHILQAGARAERRCIPAKGLTADGYDGHTFWDTETFCLQVLSFVAPEAAADALRWRKSILPLAFERAETLGLKGAAFPWRTIRGHECSGYWPAGTAAFHINADIADAVKRHVHATGDTAFELEVGLELLVATARLWRSLGSHDSAGNFRIDGVTGPDEYSSIADNNVYTNLMAQQNLRYAAEVAAKHPRSASRLGVDSEEIASWRDAASAMFIPFDSRLGVHPQSEGFTDHQRWNFEETPADRYPLLLNYPYFDLYRKQVIKQADLVLAMQIFPEAFTEEQKRRNFAYYEAITVRDSSLSACTQSVMAARTGHLELAHQYLAEAALVDLQDLAGNTDHGMHIASMAGTWTAVVLGFGGMRCEADGLSFAPVLPTSLSRISFGLKWQGRRIRVSITPEETEYRLTDGAPMRLRHHGDPIARSTARPRPPRRPPPRSGWSRWSSPTGGPRGSAADRARRSAVRPLRRTVGQPDGGRTTPARHVPVGRAPLVAWSVAPSATGSPCHRADVSCTSPRWRIPAPCPNPLPLPVPRLPRPTRRAGRPGAGTRTVLRGHALRAARGPPPRHRAPAGRHAPRGDRRHPAGHHPARRRRGDAHRPARRAARRRARAGLRSARRRRRRDPLRRPHRPARRGQRVRAAADGLAGARRPAVLHRHRREPRGDAAAQAPADPAPAGRGDRRRAAQPGRDVRGGAGPLRVGAHQRGRAAGRGVAGPYRADGRHRRDHPGRAGPDHPVEAVRRAGRAGRARHRQDGGRAAPRGVPALHPPRPARPARRARRRAEPDVPALHRAGPALAGGDQRRARHRRAAVPRPGRAPHRVPGDGGAEGPRRDGTGDRRRRARPAAAAAQPGRARRGTAAGGVRPRHRRPGPYPGPAFPQAAQRGPPHLPQGAAPAARPAGRPPCRRRRVRSAGPARRRRHPRRARRVRRGGGAAGGALADAVARAAADRPVRRPPPAQLGGPPDPGARAGAAGAPCARPRRAPDLRWTPADVALLDEAAELLGVDGAAQAAAEAAALREEVEYAQGVLDVLDLEEDLDPELLRATDIIDADRLAERMQVSRYDSTAERAAADREWTYGHIIVDEAQELSAMAWRMVMRRAPARSMTLVGDIAQAGDRGGAGSWDEVLSPFVARRWRLEQLTVNYRTPSEIADVADDVLAEIDASLQPPSSVRSTGVPPWAVALPAGADGDRILVERVRAERDAVGDGRIAVLTPQGRLDRVRAVLDAAGLTTPEPAEGESELDAPVVVLPVAASKGLEFDAVVVVEPQEMLDESPRGLNDLYVAITRATQRLGVLHSGELPPVLKRIGRP